MKIFSLFAGIGAPEAALDRLGIEYELVGFSEIDKFAPKSYCAIHNEPISKNYGDITKIDETELPDDIDLICYGFPCQDISNAGKQKGLFNEDGTKTRSGLFFDALRIIEATQPKVAIAENVKNLTSNKFKEQFGIVLNSLESAGYNNYWEVLNARDYGVPQNRERVFIVSIRNDLDTGKFEFPKPFELKRNLKEFLEFVVDESFFCKDDKVQPLLIDFECEDVEPFNTMEDGTCRCIKNQYFKNSQANFIKQTDQGATCVVVRTNNSKGYDIATIGDSINLEQPTSKTRRGRVGHGVAQTLTTSCNQATLDERTLRIRKLTPKECWRVMGFDDSDIDKCINVGVSNTQLYKQAGNSIVVDVFAHLLNSVREAVPSAFLPEDLADMWR